MGTLHDWWLHLRLQNTLVLAASVWFGLVLACTVVVHLVEGWAWLDALYFAVASVTTVGYGDFVPAHGATKAFLVAYLPVGIGVGFTVLTSLGAEIVARQRRRLERHEERDHGDRHRPPGV